MERGREEAVGSGPASKGGGEGERFYGADSGSVSETKHVKVEKSYFEPLCLLLGSDKKEFIYLGKKKNPANLCGNLTLKFWKRCSNSLASFSKLICSSLV